ncbi:hypothetical protein HYPSUDRAFT_207924 [Hypholoma sublateritium FD-334 SS-4]|uniref:Uncharacterized protein n=1 Tax=Hypholoma sublateritium (strain FD-334 SS-4) TaxID=945553 RepID=A0A0D2N8F4_HYPSF|nr:hypothetical protein HYPSUDRAFT_207924 [Hypholoma sublateritium FD-334 SS-4]
MDIPHIPPSSYDTPAPMSSARGTLRVHTESPTHRAEVTAVPWIGDRFCDREARCLMGLGGGSAMFVQRCSGSSVALVNDGERMSGWCSEMPVLNEGVERTSHSANNSARGV